MTPSRDLAERLDRDAARRLVELARGSEAPPWPRTTVVELVEQWAAQTPTRAAVSDGSLTLSYARLVERSRAVARGLLTAGVRPGDCVGVHLERSADLVVAALGVLAAGAVYVPLDAAQPEDRLRLLAEDAGVAGVVSAGATLAKRSWSIEELEAAERPAELPPPSPDDLAYVIYTSGSTGRPKGVAIRHGSVTALLEATAPLLGLRDDDVWSFVHSPSFDFSIWELFGCLATGGRLVVAPYWTARSARALHRLLARERVTVLSATPTAFSELVAADEHDGELDVRLVVLGGEQIQPAAVARWKRRRPDERCTVVNMYGITETTVHVTAGLVDRVAADGGDRSIGRPLPGWEVYVVDEDERLASVGVTGELWIAGHGLAAAYLGLEALTAARFVTRSVCGRPTRLYRSGDLGRWREDGTLEFLGRADRQVKLRGHRIELGEIEHALLRLPGVDSCVAVLRPGPRAAVLAYAVADRLDGAALRAALRDRLPDFMVPDAVVVLDRLPLTANGKVDQSALPAPEAPAVAETDDDASPLARRIARTWRDLTEVPIGLDGSFFEHGGNSITAARLADALTDAGVPVDLREVFVHASPRALAERAGCAEGGARPLRRRRSTSTDVLAVVCVPHAGAGASAFWALEEGLPPSLRLVPIALPGREDRLLEPPLTSVGDAADEVVAQVEEACAVDAPLALVGQSSGGILAYEAARRLVRNGRMPAFLLVAGTPPPTADRSVGAASHLPDRELLERLRHRTGIEHPAVQHEELRELVLPAIRADLDADERYAPPADPRLETPVVVVRGVDDPFVTQESLAGWAEVTADLLTAELDGGHLALLADGPTFAGVLERAWSWAPARRSEQVA